MKVCPSCSAKIDMATPIGGGEAQPKPGDFTICLYCAAMLRVNDADGFDVLPGLPAGADKHTRMTVAVARAFILFRKKRGGPLWSSA
jgi:hypothetical protein